MLGTPTDTADPPGPVPRLVFVEDNGATGDRFGTRTVASAVTSCPAATDADFPNIVVGRFVYPPVLVSGDFVVHDAVAP